MDASHKSQSAAFRARSKHSSSKTVTLATMVQVIVIKLPLIIITGKTMMIEMIGRNIMATVHECSYQ